MLRKGYVHCGHAIETESVCCFCGQHQVHANVADAVKYPDHGKFMPGNDTVRSVLVWKSQWCRKSTKSA